MKMKTVYYLLLGLCLATAACKPDEPEMPTDEIINGTCGKNLTWSSNKTKAILTISGTGDMEDYVIDAPWKQYQEEIQTIVIKDGVTSIGNRAFEYCSKLTQVTIPSGMTSIGESAFAGCSALTQVTMGIGITSIENATFFHCSALTAFTIPNGVTNIGQAAFMDCSALREITIPNSVTNIGNLAFNSCRALLKMTVQATVTPTVGYNAFYWVSRSIPVYVPAEALAAYKTAEGWNGFTNLQAIQ